LRRVRIRRARVGGAIVLVLLLVVLVDPGHAGFGGLLARVLGGGSASATTALATSAGVSFDPVLGLPVTGGHGIAGERGPVVIGDSPQETAGEVWAYGRIGDVPAIVAGKSYANQSALLEHTDAETGWQIVPLPAGPKGEAPAVSGTLGPLAGRTTANGGVMLITEAGLVLRDPGGQPQLVPPIEAEPALLGAGESLPSSSSGGSERSSPAFAAIEDLAQSTGAAHTGVLIAPYEDGVEASGLKPGILHYDGVEWTREPIAGAAAQKTGFVPQALACGGTGADEQASSPSNCWLLAGYKSEAAASAANRLALFRRAAVEKTAENSSGYVWEEVSAITDSQPLLGEQASSSSEPLSVTALARGAQMLTVTSQGVWVDFQVKVGSGAPVDVTKLVVSSGGSSTAASVLGSWCYQTGSSSGTCTQGQPLGEQLPTTYQSFAWPGSSASDAGTRIITGLPQGARLELSEGKFTYRIGAGGDVGGEGGAAFSSLQQGWIASGINENITPDRQGQAQVLEASIQPQGDQLQESPVPFRYPLLAVAQAPGSTPGDPNAEAVAVGVDGEIGRYTPGQGWRPESLYNTEGVAQHPTLRGVAWPEAGRIYAVGDEGTMWLWRAETGLWEQDSAEELGFIGNLTAVAFSANDPNLGYAVGKSGVLLRHSKSWEQEQLPAELEHVNFTSIAFAGNQALATYRAVTTEAGSNNGPVEYGGVAVKEGSEPWHVDPGAAALLAQLPHVKDTVLSKVAGLSDGGAVAAGPGLVIERESSQDEWHFSSEPLPEAQNISALGAYRDSSGALRAIVSIDLDDKLNPNYYVPLHEGPWKEDEPPPSGSGEPPFRSAPDPLPDSGYLLKETGSGWEDMEHMALEAPSTSNGSRTGDMPVRPDPVLGLLVSPGGEAGLAVGGQTYDDNGADNGSTASLTTPEASFQTAAAMRFGAGATATDIDTSAPLATPSKGTTFAVGGEAACETPCADYADEGLGPDVSLSHALQSANQLATSSPGSLSGFLYTGGRLSEEASAKLSGGELERELGRYESLLGSGGSLPVLAASSAGVGHTGYYSHSFPPSTASGREVRVLVLSFANGVLEAGEEAWLEKELEVANVDKTPAIVMGNAALGFKLTEAGYGAPPLQAADAGAIEAILAKGEASAYLFDYPSANVLSQLSDTSAAGFHIPVLGTGTLGYTAAPGFHEEASLGSSGFLLLHLQTAAAIPGTQNIYRVHAEVEPNIGQLALNAVDGVFLRRSQQALFEALARRPAQGIAVKEETSGGVSLEGAEPYDKIPFDCNGANCSYQVETDYTFSSSNPDIGGFVVHEAGAGEPTKVQLNSKEEPVSDEKAGENAAGEPLNGNGEVIPREGSGLFCAYNSGTTTVSITTGGLTYSEPVTVQAGSVEYPCGTVPLKNPPALEAPVSQNFNVPELPPLANPPPVSPHIQAIAPPPAPVAPAAVHPKPHHARPAPLAPFLPAVAGLALLRPALLPPPPTTPRPSPPTGTSSAQVTEGAVAPEREREQEHAIDMVHNMAAYSHEETRPLPYYLPAVILLLAFSGAGLYDARRRRRPELASNGETEARI
jgi:hypothetical protein